MAGKTVKVPQIMQMEALECGAACLGMILAYYGRWVPLEQLRVDCGVSRDGAKAGNILKAARAYGFTAKGIAYSTESLLKNAKLPCIIYWNFNHFVVFTGKKGRKYCINDPARGEVRVSAEEFESSFTGIALTFEKMDSFKTGGSKPSPLRSVIRYMAGLSKPVVFVMFATAIASVAALISTSIGRVFLDRILTREVPDWLKPILIILLILAVIWGIASFHRTFFIMRIEGKAAVVNSSKFMRHLLHLPVGFYSQRSVGDLQMRQSSNAMIVSNLIGEIAPVVINAVMLIFYAGIMIRYSLPLSLIGITAVVLNAFLASYISRKRVNIARASAINDGKLYACTVSGIDMIDTIKAAGAEEGFFRRWAGYQALANDDDVRMSELGTGLSILPAVMLELVNVVILVVGVILIMNEKFTPGSLLAFTGFLAAFLEPVMQIITLGQTIQETQTYLERIDDVMNYPVDVPEDSGRKPEMKTDRNPANNVDKETEKTAETDTEKSKLSGRVELKDVSVGYSPLGAPLIEHFDLSVEPGKWVALVGGSGSGKSTLSKLISGLYRPWSGEILFDGKPMEEISRRVITGSLAVVDQNFVVFQDTISENIRMWDRSIENYEMIMACRDAGIHETIAARQGGYSDRILSGGSNFSGGELQRMEIARALAQEPTILILDEATSALDAEVEAEVIRRIRERGITCILIAHRLSTIRDCDEIVVLEEGKVVERGTHSELIEKNGAYAGLVRSD